MKNKRYNKILLTSNLKLRTNAGFTIIEALAAILILVLTMGALFTLASGGIFSARYARNQIIANSLLQESLEAVRNSRDTAVLNGITDWTGWKSGFASQGCDTEEGCIVDPYAESSGNLLIAPCDEQCPNITFYPESNFYGYSENFNLYPTINRTNEYQTTYSRKIVFREIGSDQVEVIASIGWENGNLPRTLSQSILLTNWLP